MTNASRAVSLDLPSLTVVDARGRDAASFLQGQLSNDLIGGAGRARLAGYCNPKGRLLALPLVLTLGDGGLRLLVPEELVDGFMQRLGMFVLRADVTFERRESLRCRGLLVPDDDADGGTLAHGVAALPDQAPEAVLDVLSANDGAEEVQLLRWHDASLPFACRRYLVVARGEANEAGDATGATVGADARSGDAVATADESAWRLGDISAGIPRIAAANREAFVPQMVNLEQVGGLSFRKGCYPGQEIVARMQYLGKLKRHMRRFRVGGATAPIGAGDPIVAGADGDAGRIVDAVADGDGTELLAVVRVGLDPAALALHGAPLEPRPLPYPIDSPDAVAEADGGGGE